ncbi:MAG: ribonuclease III [Hyphomonadaceae bacterium]|nr:ribonuclease III [Hyphomonadaceae bacterium]
MAFTEADVEARIGRTFRRKALLREALTHASVGEKQKSSIDYERLEFLGDRVLGLVVAENLYARFPDEGEDKLAPRLNALVNRDACARAARRMDLGAVLLLSPAEERTGGREKDTILADACEALIAAVYLDGGLKAARELIVTFWAEEFVSMRDAPRDPKTALQEWAAQRRRPNPVYAVVARTGPDHAPHFVVEVRVDGLTAARGEGGSKRDAERAAARTMLETVGVDV